MTRSEAPRRADPLRPEVDADPMALAYADETLKPATGRRNGGDETGPATLQTEEPLGGMGRTGARGLSHREFRHGGLLKKLSLVIEGCVVM